MQLAPSVKRGFTLIELVISVAVLGILIALAIPSFQDWIHNTQIRTGAEAILDGLQTARAEAVKRNGWVQFVLTSPNTAGSVTGWQVVAVSPPPGPCPLAPLAIDPVSGLPIDPVIRTRSGTEGSASTSIGIFPPGFTTVTFDPLGKVNSGVAAGGADCTINQINVSSAVMNDASVRPLEIRISTSGGVRLCAPWVGDPSDLNPPPNVANWNLPAGDPRRCTGIMGQ